MRRTIRPALTCLLAVLRWGLGSRLRTVHIQASIVLPVTTVKSRVGTAANARGAKPQRRAEESGWTAGRER